MIVMAVILVSLAVAFGWLAVRGTGHNREDIVEYKFGVTGLSRFATYDSPLYPTNREARRADKLE